MTTVVRFARFNIVGTAGIGVQLACVAILVHGLGTPAVLATAAGVAAAVVHNFCWHVRWTWRDRMEPGVSRAGAFLRFVGANGAVSLVGSVLLMPILVSLAGLSAIPANLVTIAACGLLNYWIGGQVCFPQIRRIKSNPGFFFRWHSGSEKRNPDSI
jgi:putative flippase GtrA